MKALLLGLTLGIALAGATARADVSDAEIRERIIRDSIAAYPGT